MKNLYISVILLLMTLPCIAQWADTPNKQLYSTLDSLIDAYPQNIKAKETKIKTLRAREKNINNKEEKFWLNKMFYDEYFVYVADSAIKYVNANIRIARELNRKTLEIEWILNKVFMYSATGLLKEASELISEIEVDKIPKQLILKYYEQMIYLLSHTEQYVGDNGVFIDDTRLRINELTQKMSVLLTDDDPNYFWYKNMILAENKNNHTVLDSLKVRVNFSKLENRLDAMNAYALAHMYLNNGDTANYEKYLICSAIADVRFLNRDMAALEELSNILYNKKEIDRAQKYINYCLKQALLYPNRVRVVGISILMNKINEAYKERDIKQKRIINTYLGTTSIMSIILFTALVLIYIQLKKIRLSKRELAKANSMLNEHITELSETQELLAMANKELNMLNNKLQQTNKELVESNYVKEEYIGYVFSICSNYISKMEDFRKNISRKLKAGQIEEIKKLTNSSTQVQNELKDFYQSFDAIFLHVYPNFVKDFNELLKPEEQISLKDNESLNTELRIFALIRLGINDSTKIADFLHCSPQTIYNNRLKTRNKANIPKEEFAEAVRTLGRYNKTN